MVSVVKSQKIIVDIIFKIIRIEIIIYNNLWLNDNIKLFYIKNW